MFRPFEQADGSMTRKYGGTGLGLSICSQLAEMMGGRVWAESELGRGSTFHFTARFGVPAAPPPREDRPAPRTGGLRPLRVLLAEDNAVNQLLAVRLLQKRGHEVVVVGDGRAALEALEQGGFDVVLMDVSMPQMDGFEATGLWRQRERQRGGRRVPVIALTAHAMQGDRERCLEAGMDGYVTKPLQGPLLDRALEEALGEPEEGTAG